MDSSNQHTVTPQQPPTQNTPSSSHHFRTLPIVLGGLLFLGLGLLGGYFIASSNKQTASPNSNQTIQTSPKVMQEEPSLTMNEMSNWKTFTTTNFSLKLPNEWNQGTSKNPVEFLNYNTSVVEGSHFNATKDKGLLKIEIYTTNNEVKLDNEQTLKNFVMQEKRNAEEIRGSKDFPWIEKSLTVGDQQAIMVKTDNPGFVVYTLNTKGTKIYSIAFALDFDNYESLANQILSTFQTTD